MNDWFHSRSKPCPYMRKAWRGLGMSLLLSLVKLWVYVQIHLLFSGCSWEEVEKFFDDDTERWKPSVE